MNINSLVSEWAWRVNDGMPDPNNRNHIEMLEEVLVAHKYDREFIDQFIHQIAPLNEAAIKNSEVTKAIKAAKKNPAFNKFLKNLPGGDPARQMKNYLEKLDKKKAEEFAQILYSSSTPPRTIGGGVQKEIFNLDAKGIGKGELWLAVMTKNSEIQGGGVSFDLKADKKYEVKTYIGAGQNKAVIRLGTEGALGSTIFWQDILDTLKLLEKLNKAVSLKDYFDADFVSKIDYMIGRKGMTLKGEFNGKDMRTYNEFYKLAKSKTKSAEEGYNRIDLRGPNTRPQSFSIKPIPSNVSGNSLKVELIKGTTKDSVLSNVITELRRLKYVRQPSALDADVQKSVDNAIASGPADAFIVFRPGRVYVGNKFKFGVISQGGIKIIER